MPHRLGGQRPTFQRIGDYADTRGPDAVEMFEAYGRRYYGSQKYEMELFFARDARGGFAAKTLCITKPRQNGKSFALRDYAIWMAAVEGKSVLYTAHHGRTVRKMFKEMCDFIEAHADFRDELDYVYKAGGYEGIYFRNGACIEFQTRTNSGGRGGTYQIIVFDEAQELTNAQQDAILPTVSAGGEIADGEGDPQKIYVGTVPGPECQGTVFRTLHDRAHDGESSVWWLEWGAQGETLQDVDIDSVDLWYACNPAMGRRMSEDTVRDEHDTMSRDGFARERLGWWSPTAGKPQTLIDDGAWDACATDHPLRPERTCYGVKFAADGSEVVLAVAETRGDVTHVELQERRTMASGTAWLADWLCERTNVGCCVVVDGKSGSQALVERMSDRAPRGYVVVPSSGDVIASASMLCDAVNEKKLTWYRPQEQLKESATTATRRAIGRGGGWGFGGADPLPIEACALALWGSRTTKRNPNRKARIG